MDPSTSATPSKVPPLDVDVSMIESVASISKSVHAVSVKAAANAAL